MSREAHVRFCERAAVRVRRATHLFIFNECHLRAVLAEYMQYFNRWRPHRAIGQRASCTVDRPIREARYGEIIGDPVLGGLHHVYHRAA
jgi:putative transposase